MLKKISNFYTKSLSLYGPSPKGIGWKDKDSQDLRFSQLCQVIAKQDKVDGIVVNDFGCGYGSLFKYLNKRMKIKQYFGYDICPDMITTAKTQYPSRDKPRFLLSPRINHIADYSFASGTFTVKLNLEEEIWTEYVKQTLMKMSEKSKKGFAFNALSTYVDWKSEDAYYADPLTFFSFCKQCISKYVSLIHDYPLFEWTIIVKKEDYYK